MKTVSKHFLTCLVQNGLFHFAIIIIVFYYINTNEIPGELSRENMISSHVKRSQLLWLHDTSRLRSKKNVKVKWFGISLVFI